MTRDEMLAAALPEHRAVIRRLVTQYLPNKVGADADDLAQEAYVAMWRAVDAEADNHAAYLVTAAKRRMASIVAGRTQLGTQGRAPSSFKPRGEETRHRIREFIRGFHAEHPGKEPSKAAIGRALGLDRSTISEQMSRMDVRDHDETLPDQPATSLDALLDAYGWDAAVHADGTLDGVLLAYHDGEIAQALAALPKAWRDYVIDRFWHGMSERETQALRGQAVKWYRVRPVLAEKLAHLETAV